MSATVKISVIGSEEVLGALRRLQTVGVARVQARVARTTLAVQSTAKDLCPVDTGRLRSSIGLRFFKVGSFPHLAGEVYTNVKYAPAVEFGSGIHGPEKRPYPIVPRNKRVLRWRPAGAGKSVYVFARKVMHPGVRPRPFLLPAWEKHRDEFIEGLKQDLKTAAA